MLRYKIEGIWTVSADSHMDEIKIARYTEEFNEQNFNGLVYIEPLPGPEPF